MTDDARDDIHVTARPVTDLAPALAQGEAAEPFQWDRIPYARPISPDAFFTSSPNPLVVPVRRRRAVFELLLLIPIGFAGGVVGYFLATAAGIEDERRQNVASTVGMGAAAMFTVGILLLAGHQSLASIGWTPRQFGLEILVGAGTLLLTYVVLFAAIIALSIALPSLADQQPDAARAVKARMPEMSLAAMALFMAFVAIWEEVVFRGFVLTRLRVILGSWWLAVPISAVLFGSVHLYEGPLAVVVVGFLGLILAGLFIRRRSLVACIVMHFLHNFLMMWLMQSGFVEV